ncbi:G-protein alpha subunit-domain-containing protein [Mycena amicta]|nr:G-protein alpha subunit-domain-containing protein [Mycena amicta]
MSSTRYQSRSGSRLARILPAQRILLSPAEQAAQLRTKAIDAEIFEAKNARRETFSIVVLGQDGSGKATLLRQVELQDKPITDSEKRDYTEKVRAYIVSEDCEQGGAVPAPWSSPHYQYFLESAPRIASPAYIPTHADIIRLPQTRPPIRSYAGTLLRNTRWTTFASQRGERRKWVHQLEAVDAIVYMADLSAFDRMVVDPETGEPVNALRYDLRQLHELSAYLHLRRIPIMILLNKRDLLADTQATMSAFRTHFPDYSGEDTTAGACAYIARRYRNIARAQEQGGPWGREVPVHFCNAVDEDQMRPILAMIWEYVARGRLQYGCFGIM